MEIKIRKIIATLLFCIAIALAIALTIAMQLLYN